MSPLQVVLAVSVLLNMVLLGAGVGYGVSALTTPRVAPVSVAPDEQASLEAQILARPSDLWNRDLNPRALLAALPPEYRRTAMREFIREGRRASPVVREAMQARREVLRQIFEEEFDAEAVGRTLDAARTTEIEMIGRGHRILLSVLAEVPPDIRQHTLARVRRGVDYEGRPVPAALRTSPRFLREPRGDRPPSSRRDHRGEREGD